MATTTFPRTATNPAADDSLVALAAPGAVGEVSVSLDTSAGASDRTVMIFDAASLPANGTVPKWRFPVAGAKAASYSFPHGLDCNTGIVVALSSTEDTLTVATANEGYLHVQYRED